MPGSPFQLRVSGAPDPGKVRVYGPGVEHGVLARYNLGCSLVLILQCLLFSGTKVGLSATPAGQVLDS